MDTMPRPKPGSSPPLLLTQLEQLLVRALRSLDHAEGRQALEALAARLERARDEAVARESERENLLRAIPATGGYDALQALHERFNRLEEARFLETLSVTALQRSCTGYRDLLAARTLELLEAELDAAGAGPPPLPYALVSLGSDGREEQTLITDQDYLLVYADGGGEAADDWFAAFSERLVERLDEVGFKKCAGGIMPSSPAWRGSLSEWRQRLVAIVRYEYDDYAKNLMDLIVLSDARFVAGDQGLARTLIETIGEFERNHFQVIWQMAKAASEMQLALTFTRRLWSESAGPHAGRFNLKLLAWAPLVMNVRILAINQGVAATNTLERIAALEREGSFSPATAAELTESYHTLTRQRIRLQIRGLATGADDPYYLDPETLPEEEREAIRQALIRIQELQRQIHTNFSIQ
jgi:signal-transduction protein with cAMP-binding, CBS, and nucleotidyltransferase domain